jgi:hypothetical protein
LQIVRNWSGIASVVLLFAGFLYDAPEDSILTVLLFGLATLAYALCWYNFALVLDKFSALPLRRGLMISAVGVASTAAALTNVGVLGPIGWVVLGLAMAGVAWGIFKERLLPDGFAWISGIAGIATLIAGVTGDTSDVGTGAVYILLVWVISMSIMFVVWGRLDSVEDEFAAGDGG